MLLWMWVVIGGTASWFRWYNHRRLTIEVYPGVDPELFRRWYKAESRGLCAWRLSTIGLGIYAMVVAYLTASGYIRDSPFIWFSINAVFVVTLLWAAIMGSIAASLKKKAGIRIPQPISPPSPAEESEPPVDCNSPGK
jgi:hypothetical protein